MLRRNILNLVVRNTNIQPTPPTNDPITTSSKKKQPATRTRPSNLDIKAATNNPSNVTNKMEPIKTWGSSDSVFDVDKQIDLNSMTVSLGPSIDKPMPSVRYDMKQLYHFYDVFAEMMYNIGSTHTWLCFINGNKK